MAFDYGFLNPLCGETHRRAVQAMIAHREFLGRGQDEAARRAYETAMSYYIRAGVDADWFEDGGLGSMTVEDAAEPRGFTRTDVAVGPVLLHVLTEGFLIEPETNEFIVASTDSLTRVRR